MEDGRSYSGARKRQRIVFGPGSFSGKPLETFPVGRICEVPGCTTVLSRYNPENICLIHQKKTVKV